MISIFTSQVSDFFAVLVCTQIAITSQNFNLKSASDSAHNQLQGRHMPVSVSLPMRVAIPASLSLLAPPIHQVIALGNQRPDEKKHDEILRISGEDLLVFRNGLWSLIQVGEI